MVDYYARLRTDANLQRRDVIDGYLPRPTLQIFPALCAMPNNYTVVLLVLFCCFQVLFAYFVLGPLFAPPSPPSECGGCTCMAFRDPVLTKEPPPLPRCKESCALCTPTRCEQCIEGAVFPEFGCLTESTPNELTEVFDNIYAKRKWGRRGGLSGPGSDPAIARDTIKALEDMALNLNMRSLWDASCGSMIWMPTFLDDMEEQHNITIEFFGTDAVRGLITDHRQQFANKKHWHFAFLDFTRGTLDIDPPPDAVLIRDTLFHLGNAFIMTALESAAASGAKWLLVTNHHELTKNTEIPNQKDPIRPTWRQTTSTTGSSGFFPFPSDLTKLACYSHRKPRPHPTFCPWRK
ncbi:hypothetical protein Pelo_5396 [Pelomyxa schiedti]|nr:hypothetical protein Pelo_5396 [Pelomyxa schiedti]